MKITVLKTTVEAALAPILKMVSATKLSADLPPKLTFQSDKQSLSIGCTLPEQQLSVVLPDAVFDEKNTSFDVNLEMFRRLVAPAKGNHLSIEQDAAHVVLNCDDRFIGQLVPMTSKSEAGEARHGCRQGDPDWHLPPERDLLRLCGLPIRRTLLGMALQCQPCHFHLQPNRSTQSPNPIPGGSIMSTLAEIIKAIIEALTSKK